MQTKKFLKTYQNLLKYALIFFIFFSTINSPSRLIKEVVAISSNLKIRLIVSKNLERDRYNIPQYKIGWKKNALIMNSWASTFAKIEKCWASLQVIRNLNSYWELKRKPILLLVFFFGLKNCYWKEKNGYFPTFSGFFLK